MPWELDGPGVGVSNIDTWTFVFICVPCPTCAPLVSIRVPHWTTVYPCQGDRISSLTLRVHWTFAQALPAPVMVVGPFSYSIVKRRLWQRALSISTITGMSLSLRNNVLTSNSTNTGGLKSIGSYWLGNLQRCWRDPLISLIAMARDRRLGNALANSIFLMYGLSNQKKI